MAPSIRQGQRADSVIALSSKDLKVSDYFTPRNRSWMTKKDLDTGRLAVLNIRLKAAATVSPLRRFFLGHLTTGIVCWRGACQLARAICMHYVAEKQPPLPVLGRRSSVCFSLRDRGGAVPGR
jgi:hypothetical protein